MNDVENAPVGGVEVPREMVAGMLPLVARNSLLGSSKHKFGGGHLNLEARDDSFSFNVQNQMTADGTYCNLRNVDTIENGSTSPSTVSPFTATSSRTGSTR